MRPEALPISLRSNSNFTTKNERYPSHFYSLQQHFYVTSQLKRNGCRCDNREEGIGVFESEGETTNTSFA